MSAVISVEAAEAAKADPKATALWQAWRARLSVPVIGAPLLLISNPALVIAQCISGVIGTLPALNARAVSLLDEWLAEIRGSLADWDAQNPQAPSAPFGVNLIVHRWVRGRR